MVVYQAQPIEADLSLIVGSFGPPFGRAGGLTHVGVSRDGTMLATPIRTERPLDSATFVSAVPRADGADLCIIERSSSRVTVARWRRSSPAEAEIRGAIPVGEAPCHVAVDPVRGVGVVSAYGDGSLTTFTLGGDGSIGGGARHAAPLTRAERAQSRAHCAIFAGRYVLSSELGLDRVNVWGLEADGALIWLSSVALPKGSGPRHLRVHPSGAVYVICERSGAMATLELGEGVAHLTSYMQNPSAVGPDEEAGSSAAELAFSDDGRLAFAGMRASDSVVSYVLDGDRPILTSTMSAGRTPRHHVAVGHVLFVAFQDSDELASFEIDPAHGALRPLRTVATVSPSCVVLI